MNLEWMLPSRGLLFCTRKKKEEKRKKKKQNMRKKDGSALVSHDLELEGPP